ncbi:MAG: hypothetical protein AAB668_01000 [Patescibacteria group bacterium]
MIPLVYFLIAWLVFIAIFGLMSFITVLMNLRYGLSGPVTYLTTAVFIGVSCVVLLGVGGFLLTVDWSETMDLIPDTSNVLEL